MQRRPVLVLMPAETDPLSTAPTVQTHTQSISLSLPLSLHTAPTTRHYLPDRPADRVGQGSLCRLQWSWLPSIYF